jgi:hypothetical protein
MTEYIITRVILIGLRAMTATQNIKKQDQKLSLHTRELAVEFLLWL